MPDNKDKCMEDGGLWICHTCKTVIGPIVDDDENMCGCDVYEFELSRYVPDNGEEIKALQAQIKQLKADKVEAVALMKALSPLMDSFAEWERGHGTLACITLIEHEEFSELVEKWALVNASRRLSPDIQSYISRQEQGD